MKTILGYIRPKMKAIGLGFCVKFVGTVIELLLPWMLSVILDDYVPAGNMTMIWIWGLLMVVCAAGALVTNVAANRMATVTSRAITERLRHDLFSRVLLLSSAQEDYFTTPSLISRLTSDTYNVHQMVDRMQRLGIRAPILLIGGITITVTLDPVLALVLISTLPPLAIVIWLVSKKGIALYTKTQAALDKLILRAQESMAGIRVIQALSKGEYEKGQFDEANRQVVKREQQGDMLMNVTNPVMNLLLNGGLTMVIVVGAFRINEGSTQSGTIIAFLSYFTIILNALMMVSRLFVMYSKGVSSGRRIAEILDAPQEMEPEALPPGGDDFHICFAHVSFSYEKIHDNLSDISFALKKGETLGIIGPTGSGKSTLLNLLLRFYDPHQGAIYIGGKNLRSIQPEVLYSLFGVAFQNDFLFAGEIRENIDFGRELREEAIEKAADTAQADFIGLRERGFSAPLAPKGANLSGGQKQRLLLSRAFAGNPQILLLDDSSSALDYRTDSLLRRALSKEFAHTTKIIVAQRVSSIRGADKILVLEDGAALGYGSHQELMEHCESYREIAEIQMGEVE